MGRFKAVTVAIAVAALGVSSGAVAASAQEAPPALSVSDVTVTEGNAGETDALFTVSLDQAAVTPVSVQVDTADGTASASSGDYASGTGTVHFAPGETAQAVGIPVAPDTVDEPDETFTLELSNPSGATIADGQGVATIVDDDDPFVPPILSVGDVSVVEGDAGETPAVFVVSLDHAVATAVTVQFNTVGETADGTDFAPISGLVIFQPNETSREVEVPVFGDTVDEPDETFILELFNASGAIIADGGPGGQGADGRGVATIVDDDEPFVPPAASVGDVSVTEGDTGETEASVVVSLDHAVATPVSVEFTTADVTAAGSDDYIPVSGLVNFAPGVTSHQIPVPVIGDTLDEPDETFTVELSNPTGGATIADGQGVATIVDDDELVATSTEVTGAPNPSTVGNAVAITATVSGSDADEPTGTVTFYDGPVSPVNALGTVALNTSGSATLSTDDLAVGAHTINAVYNPDATHRESSGSYTQTVNPAPPPKLLCVRVTIFGLSIRICI